MSSNFSLLSLSIEEFDKHPRSWICISGEKIPNIISRLEKEVISKNKINREQISKMISKKLNCNHVSIKNILRGKTKFYPITVVLVLCELSDKDKYYKNKFESSVEYLKVNSASAKPIKALKRLTPNLAKIIGAFCADGSLSMQFVVSSKDKLRLGKISHLGSIKESKSRKEYYIAIQVNRNNYLKIKNFSKENKEFRIQTHYTLELTDEHHSNVLAFNKWLKEEFDIEPTFFYNRENAWRTAFSNKIIGRYLIIFFDFLPGYKADIVKEPNRLKLFNLNLRKEFAKGAIMFDGSVSKKKNITFTTISQNMAKDIKEILEKDGIKISSSLSKNNEYTLSTLANQKIKKLLEYFEKGTKKYDLLLWLDKKDFQSDQINYEDDLKDTKDILNIIKEVKICDATYLIKKTGLSHTTIRMHLKILRNKGLINLTNTPKEINDFVSLGTTILLNEDIHNRLFNELLIKFGTYEQVSKFFEVNKGTLSAWKVRKNRIPLTTLKQILKILDIQDKEINNKVEKTDRDIIEII